MEQLRKDRIRAVVEKDESVTDKDKLLLVPGVGDRTVQILEESNYRGIDDVLREEDERLAARTGLGLKRARALKVAIVTFQKDEWPSIDAERKQFASKA
jgi:N utilization substance protein A